MVKTVYVWRVPTVIGVMAVGPLLLFAAKVVAWILTRNRPSSVRILALAAHRPLSSHRLRHQGYGTFYRSRPRDQCRAPRSGIIRLHGAAVVRVVFSGELDGGCFATRGRGVGRSYITRGCLPSPPPTPSTVVPQAGAVRPAFLSRGRAGAIAILEPGLSHAGVAMSSVASWIWRSLSPSQRC